MIAKIAGINNIVKTKANNAAFAVAIPSVLIGITFEIAKDAKPTAVVNEVNKIGKKFFCIV